MKEAPAADLVIEPALDVRYVGKITDDGQTGDAKVKDLQSHERYHVPRSALFSKTKPNNCSPMNGTMCPALPYSAKQSQTAVVP